MKKIQIGISAHKNLPPSLLEKVDYIEIKKITKDEVEFFRKVTDKPFFFHVQYSSKDQYYLPTFMDFEDYLSEIIEAYENVHPGYVSFHFGPSARSISIDPEYFVAVATSTLLERKEIIEKMEKNLNTLKRALPGTNLLVENIEYIPEALSKGAYRYLQEAEFFTECITKWKRMDILDGIVFDIAHALIAAGNHPYYNGISTNPLKTDNVYLRKLKIQNDILKYYKDYISKMPLPLIKEIHISGIKRLSNGSWADAHCEIGERELEALKLLLESMDKARADSVPITLEYSKDMDKIPNQLVRLRRISKNNAEMTYEVLKCLKRS